jgi:hypothetical protein
MIERWEWVDMLGKLLIVAFHPFNRGAYLMGQVILFCWSNGKDLSLVTCRTGWVQVMRYFYGDSGFGRSSLAMKVLDCFCGWHGIVDHVVWQFC